MKTLRKLSTTLVLVLVFALPALAGEMDCPVTPPPPPPTAQGVMDFPVAPPEAETSGEASFTDAVLSLLESVLPLF